MRPLYDGCPIEIERNYSPHTGLWFDRFFDKYGDDWKVPKDGSGKLAWIETVTKTVGGTNVKIFAKRQRQLVEGLDGKTIVVKTDWHFVSGLGNNHPVENGFAWHPTLGVPYLTGAAVKGMLRAWCEQWSDFVKDEDKIRLWFGSLLNELDPNNGKRREPSAGNLIFFDAVPYDEVTLKADVMTPHMGEWYEKGNEAPKDDGSNVPADWHNPTPVPFLVVDKDQSFQFSVTCRPNAASEGIDLDEVMRELANALEYIGAGAKTAAGYGHMLIDDVISAELEELAKKEQQKQKDAEAQALAEREKEARQAEMSPLECELDDWANQAESQKAEMTAGKWIDRLHSNTVSQDDKYIIAAALRAFYVNIGRWSGGSKKHKEKIRKIKNVLPDD